MKKTKLHCWLKDVWEEVFPETQAKFVNRDNGKPDVETSLQLIETPNGSDNFLVDHKINPVYIPDVILGQMQYGGAFNDAGIITGSPISDFIGNSINSLIVQDIAGFYFIYQGPSEDYSFEGDFYNIGDWAVCNGKDATPEWSLIKNTDAITGVKGNAETVYRKGQVNLTPADLGAVDIAGDEMSGSLKTPKLYTSSIARRPGDTDPLTFTSTSLFKSATTFEKNIRANEGIKTTTISAMDGTITFADSVDFANHDLKNVDTLKANKISGPTFVGNAATFTATANFNSHALVSENGDLTLRGAPLKIKPGITTEGDYPVIWSQFGSDTSFYADDGRLYLKNSNPITGNTRTELHLCAHDSNVEPGHQPSTSVSIYTEDGERLDINKPLYVQNNKVLTNKYYIASYFSSIWMPLTNNPYGSYYTTINAATHDMGVTPTVQCFNSSGYDFKPTVRIDGAGNVFLYTDTNINFKIVIKP